MSIMSILCHTASLSGEGASLLDAGDFDEAYDCFTKALDMLVRAENNWLAQGHASVLLLPQTLEDPCLKQHHLPTPQQNNRSSLSQQQQLQKQRHRICYNNSAFFVYDEPLLFVPDTTDVTMSLLAFYKAVMLFNVALVLHKKSNCVDAWSVYRSLHFYELCLECCKDCPNHPSCLEITAAALNNKAHIYFEHCEFQTARMVLDTLLVNMIFTHGRPLEFEEKNTQGILFNLYMLRMPTSAQTA